MARRDPGPDLPGDENFRPSPARVIVIIDTPGGPALAEAMTVSPAEQAAQHHNRLRYLELQRLRAGQSNHYLETRYR
ncbi:hypothetical protein MN032_10975 [Agromyces atrinae]|uniref:hypothetical protein n=1 Tax=Agromyces atrinae TaxID=592376 RepID=UPI001F5AF9C6|nr:hypothetical protein [Agromyces atrinae]MCI2958220.1 hypothetical protein [Agromyces atrinae]